MKNAGEVLVVRSGGKVFLGVKSIYQDVEVPLTMDDVCELVVLMTARPNGMSRQVLLVGVDYSTKPLKKMNFGDVGSSYTLEDMVDEKERDALLRDYDKFCNPEEHRIVEPKPNILVPAATR